MDISLYRDDKLVVAFKPRGLDDTIYVIYSQPQMAQKLVTALAAVNYNTLYCCLTHPLCYDKVGARDLRYLDIVQISQV